MPRTFTSPQRAIVAGARLWMYAKLEVTDADGAWKDLGALASGTLDCFNTAQISERIDDNTLSFSATVLRESGATNSLSPYRSDSPLNVNAALAYAPLLDLHRYWRVNVAVLAAGSTPSGGDWREMGKGIIDEITINDPSPTITILGRGMEADLLDASIPADTVYGNDTSPIAMETVLASMLTDRLGGSAPTIVTPTSPSFLMKAWTQSPENLFPAMTTVAEKAGFNLRYRYDASDVLNLTLFQPARSATTPDWTIGPDEYLALPTASLDLSGVRNYIEVKYHNATTGTKTVVSPSARTGTVASTAGTATFSTSQAGVIAVGSIIVVAGVPYTVLTFNGTTGATLAGSPTFTASTWYSSASITRYGLRRMAIDLSAETQVTNSTAAGGFADAVRADLELPYLVQRFETFGFWFVQLHDFGKLLANGVHYNADQQGGVTEYTHSFANGTLRTVVSLRGQPAGRYATWLAMGSSGGTAAVPEVTGLTATYFLKPVVASSLVVPTIGIVVSVNPDTTRSVAILVSPNADMSSPLAPSEGFDVGSDGTMKLDYGLVTANLLKVYYISATPYDGPADTAVSPNQPTGSAGDPVQASVFTEMTPGLQTLTSATSITWDTAGALESNMKLTLAHNATLTISNAVNGASGLLILKQDGTGGRTFTLPSGVKVGQTTSINPTANKTTAIAWVYDGSAFTFKLAQEL